MTTSDQEACEVLINGAWTLTPLAEVHARHRAADKRCPDCHGRVRTQGTYGPAQAVFMYHRRAHDGCPRMPRQYAGTPKPHPDALP